MSPVAQNVLIALGVSLALYLLWTQLQPKRSLGSKSLYDRLGGVYSIAAVINRFSDALIDNPVVGRDSPNPQLRDWHRNQLERLPGLKFMRTLWVCALTGGPFQYSPTKPGRCPFSLENAHRALHISPEEFDAVGKELADAMDYYKVPADVQQEVLEAFGAHKPEVTEGYTKTVSKPTCPFPRSS